MLRHQENSPVKNPRAQRRIFTLSKKHFRKIIFTSLYRQEGINVIYRKVLETYGADAPLRPNLSATSLIRDTKVIADTGRKVIEKTISIPLTLPPLPIETHIAKPEDFKDWKLILEGNLQSCSGPPPLSNLVNHLPLV